MSATQHAKRERRARPWGDYALRALCSALLLGSGYSLLVGSAFALRMRDDVPFGIETLAFAVAAFFALVPLLFGRRYLGAFLMSSFVLAGIGAYWWTTIPWDELVTESDFATQTPPDWWRYFHVASPLVIAVLYVAASRASRMRADYRNRGVDPDEVTRAAASSFVAGMGTLVIVMGLAATLWWLLASRTLMEMATGAAPRGAPALVMTAAVIMLAWAIGSGRLMQALPPRAEAWIRRPWQSAADREARARSRGRKSPS